MTWYENSEGRHGERGKKGDAGEDLLYKWLDKCNIPFEIKSDYKSQVVDKIDVIVDRIPADVKTNVYMDHHCVELKLMNGRAGWLYTSTAFIIIPVDLDTKSIFSYRISDMKQFVNENQNRVKITKHGDTVLWVSIKEDFMRRLK